MLSSVDDGVVLFGIKVPITVLLLLEYVLAKALPPNSDLEG